jgi:hypothetical protein
MGAPHFSDRFFDPVLKLIGDIGQGRSGYPLAFAVGVEEPEHPFRLLEGLDETVQQNPVEASIPELDATLVVFVKGVHGALLCGEIPGAYRRERLTKRMSLRTGEDIKAQPWLV